ncbi:MAG: 4-alpha-glucanotransferase [Thermodesulfobacteriota bacterium]
MGDTIVRLAQACGVEPVYYDNWGKPHHTDPDTAKMILASKGISLDPARVSRGAQVLVASIGELPETFSIRLFPNQELRQLALGPGPVNLKIVLDSAGERTFQPEPTETVIRAELPENSLLATIPFPRDLAVGIHRVEAEALFQSRVYSGSCRWIVCPQQAHVPADFETGRRVAGIGIALYGVRSRVNWGIGDFGDLTRIVDWAADDLQVDFVGLNPLHALFNRSPFNSSPYSPSSRLYRNYIYLDVPAIPDFVDSKAARQIVEARDMLLTIRRLREAEHVRYEEVAQLKLRVLREVFRTFMELHSSPSSRQPRWTAFRNYVDREGIHLRRFATFCALDEHFRNASPPANTWQEWPKEFRDPASEAVRTFRRTHEDEVRFWMYLQWQVDAQLRNVQQHATGKGMVIGLFHDEALAVDRSGADVWAAQDCYHDGFNVGAPPDAFAPDGQNWGFSPPDTDRVRTYGYEPFLRRLAASCTHGGALRIDHVMQFSRLFWIPRGQSAAHGVYVRDREKDLLNLLVLQSARNRTLIVGEDLGTVPYDFRDRLMSRGVFSYRLFYFERDGNGDLIPHYAYPQHALVSISTHDLPTLAEFWGGLDIDEVTTIGMLDRLREKSFREDRHIHKAKIIEKLVQEGFLPAHVAHEAWIQPFPTDHLHSAVLKFVIHTPARLVMVSQEDLFLDPRRQNVPGTTNERPNWVTKMRYTVEELRTDPEAVRMSEKYRNLLRDAGRGRRW